MASETTEAPMLVWRGVCHHYTPGKPILRELDLSVAAGEILCLLGPSGCGKTTALRTVAGFEPITAGEITLDGTVVSRPGMVTPPEQRDVGLVFQEAALFPHLSIAENIAFGIWRRPKAEQAQRVGALLAMVALEGHGSKLPHQLSGGQRQRAALARAMAPSPRVILLDEPFSALDADLRRSLSREVRRILKDGGVTAVLVTHDQQEAFAMADRTALLHNGRLEQVAGARELYQQPATPFVAGFIGEGAFYPATVRKGNCDTGFHQWPARDDWAEGDAVQVFLRPEAVRIAREGSLEAEVVELDYRGGVSFLRARLREWPEVVLDVRDTGRGHRELGEKIHLHMPEETPPVFKHRGEVETKP
ncbi:ABC transporter ATP-binding protein [Acanthopleuribacter pedis]|uniref:ABC transporter ATP-binding protein n=1 Tax=Acanthopleuribacter pedis TaxID=442870 RepID=A0A8J7QC26_9BACT|nr:ABC transporter ATP-binding protein [Acanthopleuribacter pedis]MBO1322891.1 ABC transporter ATP-binding protein [Acanthopleuribacter pedis]